MRYSVFWLSEGSSWKSPYRVIFPDFPEIYLLSMYSPLSDFFGSTKTAAEAIRRAVRSRLERGEALPTKPTHYPALREVWAMIPDSDFFEYVNVNVNLKNRRERW